MAINSTINITTNGTTQLFQTLASVGYQFAAFINGNAGAWNGAVISIQILPDNISQPITIATLTESNPFIEKIQMAQGLYLQLVVTGANIGTSLNVFFSPLAVYGN